MIDQKRHILVSLLGRTPQILTETLYALMVGRKIPISEIWVLTTREGFQEITEKLLDSNCGKFYDFCQDWNINPHTIKFDSNHIKVAHDLGDESTISPNREKCEPLVDLILQVMRKLTKDPKTILHCSLAGGRKTMSVYFAFALQFYGRPQDKLYHLLTQPQEFQNHPDFYYIPPQPRMLDMSDGKKLSTENASIELVTVPYVRLRNKMGYLFGMRNLSFDEMVRLTQTELEQMPNLPVLLVDLQRRRITIGNKEIPLSPIEIATYQYYAERSLARDNEISVKDYERYFEYAEGSFFPEQSLNRLLEIYSQVATQGTIERFKNNTLENGRLPFDRACEHFSRIKRKIRHALNDDALADYYIISAVGRYGKCYGIKLDKSKIVIVP